MSAISPRERFNWILLIEVFSDEHTQNYIEIHTNQVNKSSFDYQFIIQNNKPKRNVFLKHEIFGVLQLWILLKSKTSPEASARKYITPTIKDSIETKMLYEPKNYIENYFHEIINFDKVLFQHFWLASMKVLHQQSKRPSERKIEGIQWSIRTNRILL